MATASSMADGFSLKILEAAVRDGFEAQNVG
jgi:hypothetical protein